jgi:hypothetical protein
VTSGRIDVIDDWLVRNIKGTWSIKLMGGDEPEGTMKYAVHFAGKSDHALFCQRFNPKRTA